MALLVSPAMCLFLSVLICMACKSLVISYYLATTYVVTYINHLRRLNIYIIYIYTNSLSVGKESAFSAEDQGSIPGLGRSPGERNGNSLQYSCLENLVDREAWWATVYGLARVRHYLVNKPPLNIYANKNFSKF